MFYFGADPAVIAYDEAHKDVVSQAEIEPALAAWAQSPDTNGSMRITAPVHVVLGDHDALCLAGEGAPDPTNGADLIDNERRYFPRARSLAVTTIPGTGHNLALHPTAGQTFTVIDDWLRSVGTTQATAASEQ